MEGLERRAIMRTYRTIIEPLRTFKAVGSSSYYLQIRKATDTLMKIYQDPNDIVQYLLPCMEDAINRYQFSNTNWHLFELSILQMVKISNLYDGTLRMLYAKLFPRVVFPQETYAILCFFEKVFHSIILKEERTEILQKLQLLMSPCDKKSARLVISIATYIITEWDDASEKEVRFHKFISLPKWGKLEFYIFKAYYGSHVKNRRLLHIVIERIFYGFQEDHSAHAANVLLQYAFTVNTSYRNVILEDVVALLKQFPSNYKKTFHSSLVNYVIPTLCDALKERFLHCQHTFHPIYRLHTMKYSYNKRIVNSIDVDFLLNTLYLLKEDKEAVMIVWKLTCTFANSTVRLSLKHLDLFYVLTSEHYYANCHILKKYIHMFLSQLFLSRRQEQNPFYADFLHEMLAGVQLVLFGKCTDKQQAYMETHTFLCYLLTHNSDVLKTNYNIATCMKYSIENNPYHSLYDLYMNKYRHLLEAIASRGVMKDFIYNELGLTRKAYDEKFVCHTKQILFNLIDSPNLDQKQKIINCSQLLLEELSYHKQEMVLQHIRDELLLVLSRQIDSIQECSSNLTYLANPVYSTAAALYVFAAKCPVENVDDFFYAGERVISLVLPKVSEIVDIHIKKFIEQIFLSFLELMWIATKRSMYCEKFVHDLILVSERVMCESKLRKVNSSAVKIIEDILGYIISEPFFINLLKILSNKITTHLEGLKRGTLRRCTGNKEMLLLICKVLADFETESFIPHFEKMLDVDVLNQEMHLNALEAICNDASLRDFTQKYLIQLFLALVKKLSHRDFSNRNAAAQLLQVISNRLMGTKSELGSRPLSIVHVFQRYPEMLKICVEILNDNDNVNSKLAVLAFIGDTPYNPTVFDEACQLPLMQIRQLMKMPFLKMTGIRAYANLISYSDIHSTICKTISSFSETNNPTIHDIALLECLVTRYIDLHAEPYLEKEIFEKICSLTNRNLPVSNCVVFHHGLSAVRDEEIMEFVEDGIRKCLHQENPIAFIVICTFIELIFHRLDQDRNKTRLLVTLIDMFFQFSNVPRFVSRQYYSSITNLLTHIPMEKIASQISRGNFTSTSYKHIFAIDIFTQLLCHKNTIDLEEKTFISNLRYFLPSLIQKSHTLEHESIINILNNYLNLCPKLDLTKCDFYYIFVVALIEIEDKLKFTKMFKIITRGEYPIIFGVQYLFKLIKCDLKQGYRTFLKELGIYFSSLNKFFVEYPPLYDCFEEDFNVKVDIYLLQKVMRDFESL